MRYALKKLRRMRLYDLATGMHKVSLIDLSNIQIQGSQEEQNAQGADGAILASFDVNKTATITATNGSIETGYIALQVGSDEVVVKNGTDIMIREIHKLESATEVTLDHKASGATGNEIGYIYKGGYGGVPQGNGFVQGAVASETEFAYDPETKVITLPTGKFAVGDIVVIDYYPTFAQYTEISNDSNKFSETCKVIIDAWFTDICTKKDIPLQILCPQGKISGEIDMSFGDQAAVQNISITALTDTCDDETQTLWKLFNYDMEEIVDD